MEVPGIWGKFESKLTTFTAWKFEVRLTVIKCWFWQWLGAQQVTQALKTVINDDTDGWYTHVSLGHNEGSDFFFFFLHSKIQYPITLRWMSLDLSDDQSTLLQVMAWCLTAPSHYLSQCWPNLHRHMVSLGHNQYPIISIDYGVFFNLNELTSHFICILVN